MFLTAIAFLALTLVLTSFVQRRFGEGRLVLLAGSLFFYGWLRPRYLPFVCLLVFLNWIAVYWNLRWASMFRGWIFVLLVIGDLGILALFKYSGGFAAAIGQSSTPMGDAIIPLGLSFIVFRLVSYVLDVRAEEKPADGFVDFLLYCLFFPTVLCGPLLRFEAFGGQLGEAGKIRGRDAAVGVSLIAIGMFKNLVLAPLPAAVASQIAAAGAAGTSVSFVTAWAGVFAYGLQLYFDFSGYSDAAVGVARLLGIRLPANFHSPYKARSMVEFWQRWHVSLTKMLTGYIYNPMALAAARYTDGRGGRIVAFVARIAVPSLIVMALMGVWHGERVTFLMFGLYHGGLLVLNHVWRAFGGAFRKTLMSTSWWGPVAWVITLVAAMSSWAIFQATSGGVAVHGLASLTGAGGFVVPDMYAAQLGPLAGLLRAVGVDFRPTAGLESCFPTLNDILMLAGLTAVVLFAPNSNQLLSQAEPVLSGHGFPKIDAVGPTFAMRFSARAGVGIALILVVSAVSFLTNDRTTLIYFRF